MTPNVPEAEALSGRRIHRVDGRCARCGAARFATWAPPRSSSQAADHRLRVSVPRHGDDVVDLLFDGRRVSRIPRAANRQPPHARHRVHVRIGGRRRPRARPRACRRRAARAAVRRRRDRARAWPSVTAAVRSIISGSKVGSPEGSTGLRFYPRTLDPGARILEGDAAAAPHRDRPLALERRRGVTRATARRRRRRGRDVSRPGAQPQPRAKRPISGVRSVRAAGAQGVRADRRPKSPSGGRARGSRCITASAGCRSAKPASPSRRARRIAATPMRPAATRSSA